MDIEILKRKNVVIITPVGELDHHSCQTFRQRVDDLLLKDNFANVILDFERLTFMDSSGLGVIVGRYKLCKSAGGTLVIANCNPAVKRLVELGGLNKLIKVCHNIDAAILQIA